MRKLIIKEWNEFGDAKVELVKITPPDEVEAKAKFDAEAPKRKVELLAKASPETLAKIARIKARMS